MGYTSDRGPSANIHATEKQAFLNALAKKALLPQRCCKHADAIMDWPNEQWRAVYKYFAHTLSRITLVSMEDLLGDVDTPVIPDQQAYPSWRIKIGSPNGPWEQWKSVERVRGLAQAFRCRKSQKKQPSAPFRTILVESLL